MPLYAFIAHNTSGSLERGELVGETPAAVRENLQRRGLRLLSIEVTKPKSQKLERFLAALNRGPIRSISSQDIELLQQQLAVMLSSGLALAPSLCEIGRHATRRSVQRLCGQLSAGVEQGESFASMLESSRAFPPLVVKLVQVGEKSDELPATLQRAALFMQKRRQAMNSLLSALAYPAVVALAACSVAAYLVGWAIPKLADFLFAMGRSLPPMTQSLIDVSNNIREYGPIGGILAFALVIGGGLLYSWQPGRYRIDQAILRIPGVGRLVRLSETQLLASSLALMLRNGMLLQDALQASIALHRNRYLAKQVEISHAQISKGRTLADSLQGFEPMLTSMVSVGEQTGNLPSVLDHVADFHATQLDTGLKRIAKLIEPVIIVFVGGMVGYVYVAFFMALMSAGGNFN